MIVRMSGALLAAVFLVAACVQTDEGPIGSATDPFAMATDERGSEIPTPATRSEGEPSGDQREPDPKSGRRSSEESFRVNDRGSPGANAPAYLRGSVPRLVVEIDAVQGKAPQPQTVTLVRSRLEAVADKPGGITILPTETIPPRGGAWTFDALREAEARHRDTHSTSERASMYVLFVDGTPPKRDAIGTTYSSSAAAIFVDQIADVSTLLVTAAAIERAATVHEVGHLLSLVNFGYRSPRNREDPEHPGHSKNQRSVMYWAVDNVGVVTILGGRTEPPTQFDRDDLADLADIRAGKLP